MSAGLYLSVLKPSRLISLQVYGARSGGPILDIEPHESKDNLISYLVASLPTSHEGMAYITSGCGIRTCELIFSIYILGYSQTCSRTLRGPLMYLMYTLYLQKTCFGINATEAADSASYWCSHIFVRYSDISLETAFLN